MQNAENAWSLPKNLKRALLIALAVVLVAAAALIWWFVATYRSYNVYRSMIRQPEAMPAGTEFKALKDQLKAVPGFSLAAENDRAALYVKTASAEIALYDKQSGVTLYSNPQDADKDPIAKATNLERLKSQFILSYMDANAKEGTAWSSYAKSVANGQVAYENIENGVRVIYSLSTEKILLVPDQLTPEWYEILSTTGKKQAAKSYELNEESGLYEIKTKGVTSRNKQQIDLDARNAGFTMDDYEAMQALKVKESEEEETESLSFSITLDWILTEDGAQVTMPYEGLQEFGGGQIRAVQLLPFFGAAGEGETGYLVLPDGSGALMDFNNGKSAFPQYNKNIYDLDLVDSDYAAPQNIQTVRLPLYGICRENSGLLATCERGATLANVVADVAGRNNNYNFAYFAFNLRRTDTLTVAGEDVIVAEREIYPVDCTVRYTLLNEDYLGYSGLARAYRERLLAEGRIQAAEAKEADIPFYYDIIGGVKEMAHWLGVQYLRVLPMTTFAEAENIVTELKHENIANQQVNLQGWMNGGYYHDVVKKVKVLRQLGGESGLASLSTALTRSGGALYPDAALQLVTDITKGFFPSEEASRYYAEGYVVELGVVSPVSLRRLATLGYNELGYMLLSPKFLPRYAENLNREADRLKLNNLSLRDLGNELHADKRRTNVINREMDLDIVNEAFRVIAGDGRSLMVSGGNDYSFAYTDHVLNAPVQYTSYPILDEEIPLWEMIVHGSIEYAGSAMNLTQSENHQRDLLRLVEYGASVHYTFTWRDAAEMKYTGLNSRFATTFSAWKDDAVSDYRFVNGALRAVSGAAMEKHERLTETLSRVTYSNGVTIYVNQGDEEVQADGNTIPALNYAVVGGEAL